MRLKIGLPVLALLLAASTALGQNAQSQTSSEPLKVELPERVETAHCAYAPTDTICEANAPSGNAPVDHNTLAQLPGRMPTPPSRLHEPPMGSPYSGTYRGTWAGAPDGRHVLIGAAIGFGLGAAAGSKSGVRASLGIGAIFGLIGAGLGAGVPSFPHPNRYRRGWDDDEEASNHRPRHKIQPKPLHDSARPATLARSNPPESPSSRSALVDNSCTRSADAP
jgi:hypothetical protein